MPGNCVDTIDVVVASAGMMRPAMSFACKSECPSCFMRHLTTDGSQRSHLQRIHLFDGVVPGAQIRKRSDEVHVEICVVVFLEGERGYPKARQPSKSRKSRRPFPNLPIAERIKNISHSCAAFVPRPALLHRLKDTNRRLCK